MVEKIGNRVYTPNGRKSRKQGFAGEVCAKSVMAELEFFWLGTKSMRFAMLSE